MGRSLFEYIYTYKREAMPHSPGPRPGGFEILGGSVQVGGLGGPLGFILGLVGVWEAKRRQGRGLEGLGVAQMSEV